jgi:hypothetical protein
MLVLVCLATYQPVWRGDLLWDDDAHVTSAEFQPTSGLCRIWFDVGATQQYYPSPTQRSGSFIDGWVTRRSAITSNILLQ